jgi:hypothetical protein
MIRVFTGLTRLTSEAGHTGAAAGGLQEAVEVPTVAATPAATRGGGAKTTEGTRTSYVACKLHCVTFV